MLDLEFFNDTHKVSPSWALGDLGMPDDRELVEDDYSRGAPFYEILEARREWSGLVYVMMSPQRCLEGLRELDGRY